MNQTFEIVSERTKDRIVILHVKGRVDHKTADILMKQGTDVAADGANLIVDLSGVTFMGSSGVGTLLALFEHFEEQAGIVRFAAPSPCVWALIDLLRLQEVLSIDGDRDTALQAIRSRSPRAA